MKQVINFMDAYDLDQDDLGALLDIGQIGRDHYEELPTSLKTQFTKQ